MLYRNGENLKSGLTEYLTNKNKITIFSPYIKVSTLKYLLNTQNLNCEQIIVRWEPKDLAMGSSDIEVYELCKKNKISLFMNKNIHLKLFTNDFSDAFSGSSNISERAISEKNGNYEVCTYLEYIDREDRLYLQKIVNESILITDQLYEFIKNKIPIIDNNLNNTVFDIPVDITYRDDFLISKLPMTDSPELLWEFYSNLKQTESNEQENCLSHDLVLYQLDNGIIDKSEFDKILSTNFMKNPFISTFLQHIDKETPRNFKGQTREGLQFGAVKKWFAENTSTAPTPRAFELTKNVQILYRWIESLSKGDYIISIPGTHSQVIKKANYNKGTL